MKAIKLVIAILAFGTTLFAVPGDLDNTFGMGGKVETVIGPSSDVAYAVAIQADGKIVVAGSGTTTTGTSTNDFVIVRYNVDGSLDTTFDTDGIQVLDVSEINQFDQARGVVIKPNGKILVGGNVNNNLSASFFALVQLNSDGSLDTTFGSNGKVTADFAGSVQEYVSALALDSNGRIVLGGYINTHPNADFAVARFNTDGSPDTSFSGDGQATADVAGFNDFARGMAIDSSDNIYIVGISTTAATTDFGVVKFLSNGNLDASFDGDGTTTIDMAGLSDLGNSIAIDSNNKAVLAGGARVGSLDTGLVRLNTDGTLDATFGTNGKVIQQFAAGNDYANSLIIQADGKILTGGTFFNLATSNFDFAVARFNSDGSLDNSLHGENDSLWGTGGIASANFPTGSEARALAFYPGGKLVVAGSGSVSGNDFRVARFENLAATAASASISGSVSTGKLARGLANVVVYITQQDGNIITARTNQFGYFRFEDIEVGQTLILNAFHKQYQFSPQVINLNDSISGLVLTAQ